MNYPEQDALARPVLFWPVFLGSDILAVDGSADAPCSLLGIYRRSGFENGLLSVPPSRPHIRTIYDSFQHGMAVGRLEESPERPFH